MFEEGSIGSDNDLTTESVWLYPCADTNVGVSPFLGTGDPGMHLKTLYVELASAVLLAERGLKPTDYPEELWRPYLAAYEEEILAAGVGAAPEGWLNVAGNPHYAALLLELSDYREHNGPDAYPETAMGEGCGDGGFEVSVVTEPAGGKVWSICEFEYKSCREAGIDPDDRLACGWVEETGVIAKVVAGNYRFFAEWPDGRTSRGRRSFLDAAKAEMQVVIRP
jgi:hypothetical protein